MLPDAIARRTGTTAYLYQGNTVTVSFSNVKWGDLQNLRSSASRFLTSQ
jgi:hypothetical protein